MQVSAGTVRSVAAKARIEERPFLRRKRCVLILCLCMFIFLLHFVKQKCTRDLESACDIFP